MTRIAFLAVLMVMAGACTRSRESPATTVTPVHVSSEIASMRPLASTFEAGGVVAARTTATIVSRIVAPVVSVNVAVGDRVRAGQRLITLDDRDLASNRTRVAASLSALERTASAAAADRDAADAALTLARATHGRIETLYARRSATLQELDEARTAVLTAEARLRATDARVAETGAAIESARGAATGAEVAASFAVLAAPFDGIVTEKLVEPGNLAAVGVPLLRLEDTRRFRLEVRVDESRAAATEIGDRVHVAWDTSGASQADSSDVDGTIAELSRAIESASHAFLVKIDLAPHPRLRSGMFARARFSNGARQALTVPDSAIVRQGQLATVFVVTGEGRARMRVVRTGDVSADRVEIVAGVARGEQVIVGPPPSLRDGDLVQVDRSTASNHPRRT